MDFEVICNWFQAQEALVRGRRTPVCIGSDNIGVVLTVKLIPAFFLVGGPWLFRHEIVEAKDAESF